MSTSHVWRFAHEALPTSIFENPVAFSRVMSTPRALTMLGASWDAAGGRLSGADRRTREGMTVQVVPVAPYTVVLVQPPFPRDPTDACAIVVVGKGDGENQFDGVRYFIVELMREARFVLLERREGDEQAQNLGNAPPDLTGLVEACVDLTAGRESTPRERYGTVPPWYWWHVLRGPEAFGVFNGAPESEAWNVVHNHPVLLMPELLEAAVASGLPPRPIEGLRQMHAALRGTPHFAPFHRLLANALADQRGGVPRLNLERALAVLVEVRAAAGASGPELGRALACEAGLRVRMGQLGHDTRRNYERARELFETARKEPAEPAEREADEREEQAVRAALARLAPPPTKTTDPAWPTLFLDETELVGFERREDRRDQNPITNDRAFAEQHGISAGSVVWLGQEFWAMWRVVDTRWLFPSVATAIAYADAMVVHVGESLPPLPVPAIGDAVRGWGGIELGKTPGTRYAGQILFIRVGRMVAKLFVAEGPKAPQAGQALAQSMLFPYAEAIVRRAHWALSRYWLAIGRGNEAANAFLAAPPLTAVTLLAQYPILALPEFPAAMAALGEAHRAAGHALWQLQEQYKTDYSYRTVVRPLVRMLLDEQVGDGRVNAHAAMPLILHMRTIDRDPAWAQLEAECRARL
jgi:hypothetical protein